MRSRRSFLAPEILQTSAMDCGPAVLKSVLSGWGISVNYARLRDACSTGADGTSIDTLEALAEELGFEARQQMAPLPDAREVLAEQAPCILILDGAGAQHFVVLWRALGPFWQIMDPARGRTWVRTETFLRELLVHRQRLDGDDFVAWFARSAWRKQLVKRVTALGAGDLVAPGDEPDPAEYVAAVDGAARLVEVLAERGVIAPAARPEVLRNLVSAELQSPVSLFPPALSGTRKDDEGAFQAMQGVVYLTLRRREVAAGEEPAPLTERAQRLLGTTEPRLLHVLARNLSPSERRDPLVLAGVALLVSALAFVEMLFLRAAFNASSLLSLPQQRIAGTALYAGIVVSLFVLEIVLSSGLLGFARALELRTRLALLKKLPRLPDRYFRTRPKSDIVHRCLGLFDVKAVPELVGGLAMRSVDLVVTCTALAIVYPRGLPFVVGTFLFGLVVPYLSIRLRSRVEARRQTHASALAGIYLDSLLGLLPLRSHGGQTAMRVRQEGLLVDWRLEAERSLGLLALTEAVQLIGMLTAIVLLLLDYRARAATPTALLLIAFWALRLPFQAQGLLATMQRVPGISASLGRLVEPLTAEEIAAEEPTDAPRPVRQPGLGVEIRDVSAVRGTESVLQHVSLTLAPGEHVAVVGSSGAGKSSLVSVLLGLLDVSEGAVLVDGAPLRTYGLANLRRETVWVDPAVQLWDRPLLDNVLFGNPRTERHPIQDVLENLLLADLLEKLPEGLGSLLGESGARLSGGEGQRVRLSRALLRRGARLILLDEAFRGLERPIRRELSRRVRARARGATVVEVTHDVAETTEFDRVFVIEHGRVVEAGRPSELLEREGSRYAALVQSDVRLQTELWDAPMWRRVTVEMSRVVDGRGG